MTSDQFLKAREIYNKVRNYANSIEDIKAESNFHLLPQELFERHKREKLEFFEGEIARLEMEFDSL